MAGFALTLEDIAALAEIHLANDYPNLMRRILMAAEETLKQGFDVEKFMTGRAENPDRLSSFYGISSDISGGE